MTSGRRLTWGAVLLLAVLFSTGCRGPAEEEFAPAATAEPACVKRGEKMTVVTTNAKGANVVYVPTYADGHSREETAAPRGDANDKGVFRGSWTVPKSVPPGRGIVRVAVAAGSNGKQLQVPFAVAEDDGSCSPAEATPTTAPSTSSTVQNTNTTKPGETTLPTSSSTTVPAGGSTTSTTQVPIAEGGDFKTTVTFAKACVEPGGSQTIRVQAAERGILTYAVGYAEGSPPGNSNGGTTSASGSYQDTFIVDPLTKPGTATAQVSVKAGDRQSFAGARFQVGGC